MEGQVHDENHKIVTKWKITSASIDLKVIVPKTTLRWPLSSKSWTHSRTTFLQKWCPTLPRPQNYFQLRNKWAVYVIFGETDASEQRKQFSDETLIYVNEPNKRVSLAGWKSMLVGEELMSIQRSTVLGKSARRLNFKCWLCMGILVCDTFSISTNTKYRDNKVDWYQRKYIRFSKIC